MKKQGWDGVEEGDGLVVDSRTLKAVEEMEDISPPSLWEIREELKGLFNTEDIYGI